MNNNYFKLIPVEQYNEQDGRPFTVYVHPNIKSAIDSKVTHVLVPVQSHAVSGDVEEMAKEYANDIIGDLEWLDMIGQADWSNVCEAFKSGYAAAPQQSDEPTLTIQQALELWQDARDYYDGWLYDKRTYFLNKFDFNIDKTVK